MVLFEVQVGIIRMHGEADDLHVKSLQGTRKFLNLQDFLSPCAKTPITVTHPLPPIHYVELGYKAHAQRRH